MKRERKSKHLAYGEGQREQYGEGQTYKREDLTKGADDLTEHAWSGGEHDAGNAKAGSEKGVKPKRDARPEFKRK